MKQWLYIFTNLCQVYIVYHSKASFKRNKRCAVPQEMIGYGNSQPNRTTNKQRPKQPHPLKIGVV